MTISLTSAVVDIDAPRPKDVGVLAMEVYFPRRVRIHVPLSSLVLRLMCFIYSVRV